MLLQIPARAPYLFSLVVGILYFASFLSVGTAATVVQTKIGKIRGLEEITSKQTKYYAFKGVRYARAPLGNLRFKVIPRIRRLCVYKLALKLILSKQNGHIVVSSFYAIRRSSKYCWLDN